MSCLIDSHPVFIGLPQRIKEKLMVIPAEDVKALPGNRRSRKTWRRDGCVLHLLAGEKEGYTFERAVKEVCGSKRQVIEVDIKRGDDQDLRQEDCYAALLRLAMSGSVKVVLGGPNCRTRSVLRTYPGGPPPSRSWDGEEFGKRNSSAGEQQKVDEDDEMMWKMILIYLVAKFSRRIDAPDGGDRHVYFLLEQPAPPYYKKEVVSFRWTDQWRELCHQEGLSLLQVNQGDYGAWTEKWKRGDKGTRFGGRLQVVGKMGPWNDESHRDSCCEGDW